MALFTCCSIFLFTPAAATLQQLQVGMAVPDFSLRLISGETRSFADIKGQKMTVIAFWTTWDKNSEKALARLQKLHLKYHDQGLAVIAVNADAQNIPDTVMEQIKAKIERLGITFPVFIDHGLTYFHDVGVIALPTTVIVDKDRNITYELSGYPLVGSEEMADFIVATLEGKALNAVVAKKGYQPNKQALRLYNMGINTLKSGRMADSAEMWFKKAAEADTRFVLPHISLGKFYLQRGEKAQAAAQFKEALAKEPTHVIALCESALMMFTDGKFAEGQALLAQALKTDEYYTPCYYYAGFAYGKQGKPDDAVRMFDEAEKLNPMDYNIHVYKGRMFEEMKNLPKAAEAYRKALETILSLN
ncbi:MAG TPA: redoxin domain-containing protein [Dongiaceae bacterium]|nr:redoxin domain-containing protein [Dongiaceae bacterium]